jgi:hypothetical protein
VRRYATLDPPYQDYYEDAGLVRDAIRKALPDPEMWRAEGPWVHYGDLACAITNEAADSIVAAHNAAIKRVREGK